MNRRNRTDADYPGKGTALSKFTERSTAPIENTTIVNQLSHRTFRRFTDERLTEEQVDTLIEVARRTATS